MAVHDPSSLQQYTLTRWSLNMFIVTVWMGSNLLFDEERALRCLFGDINSWFHWMLYWVWIFFMLLDSKWVYEMCQGPGPRVTQQLMLLKRLKSMVNYRISFQCIPRTLLWVKHRNFVLSYPPRLPRFLSSFQPFTILLLYFLLAGVASGAPEPEQISTSTHLSNQAAFR